MRRATTMLLPAMAMLIACTEPAPPPSPPPSAPHSSPAPPRVEPPRTRDASVWVTTDRDRYVMAEGPYGPETTIVTTFHAPADRQVNIVNCNGAFPIGLQRLTEGDKWVDQWAAAMNACASPPIVIPPGGQHTGTMVAESGAEAAVDSRTSETKIETGTYRVVWYAAEGLPLEQRVSAPVFIEAAPRRDPSQPSPVQRPAEIAAVEPAHGARAAADAPVRIRFTLAQNRVRRDDPPHVYVDRAWANERVRSNRTADVLELEYRPERRWTPGRHDVRVVYRDETGETRWYAWSFVTGQ